MKGLIRISRKGYLRFFKGAWKNAAGGLAALFWGLLKGGPFRALAVSLYHTWRDKTGKVQAKYNISEKFLASFLLKALPDAEVYETAQRRHSSPTAQRQDRQQAGAHGAAHTATSSKAAKTPTASGKGKHKPKDKGKKTGRKHSRNQDNGKPKK